MFCYVISPCYQEQQNNSSWRGRRFVEVLGYSSEKGAVEILGAIYIENLLPDGKNNYFYILHPGNVKGTLLSPDLKMQHPWEIEAGKSSSILEDLYGRAFYLGNDDTLFQTDKLTSADRWIGQDIKTPERVYLWPEGNPNLFFKRVMPLEDSTEHVPFTCWKLGPFTKHGAHLVYFRMSLTKGSYSALINDPCYFTIDGPDRLLALIRYSDLPSNSSPNHDSWQSMLDNFNKFTSAGEGYDVIILGKPCADDVCCEDCSEAEPGELALLPYAQRFLTYDPAFRLSLKYNLAAENNKNSALFL